MTLILVPLRKNQFSPLDQALQESPKASYPKLPFFELEKSNFPSWTAVDAGVVLSRHILAGHQNSGGGLPVPRRKNAPTLPLGVALGPARPAQSGRGLPCIRRPDTVRGGGGGASASARERTDPASERRPSARSTVEGGGKAGLVRGAIPDPSLPPILSFSIQVPLAA